MCEVPATHPCIQMLMPLWTTSPCILGSSQAGKSHTSQQPLPCVAGNQGCPQVTLYSRFTRQKSHSSHCSQALRAGAAAWAAAGCRLYSLLLTCQLTRVTHRRTQNLRCSSFCHVCPFSFSVLGLIHLLLSAAGGNLVLLGIQDLDLEIRSDQRQMGIPRALMHSATLMGSQVIPSCPCPEFLPAVMSSVATAILA